MVWPSTQGGKENHTKVGGGRASGKGQHVQGPEGWRKGPGQWKAPEPGA